MSKRIGVLIGRFQGYHYFHHEHLRRAALLNDILIVFIGSPNVRKSIKNPWNFEERVEMIEMNVKADPELKSTRIVFRTVPDQPNDNNLWAESVKASVSQFLNSNSEVTIYGCKKDASSFYLDMFPEWEHDLTEVHGNFDATKLRRQWFMTEQTINHVMLSNHSVPDATLVFLHRQEFNENLQDEWKFYEGEKARFANYPFPETLNFNCGDAVVVCHGKVLMIRRKHSPGKGCLALPGGFKNRDETFFEAVVRELYEETAIDIPKEFLMKCFVRAHLFDDPSRSIGIPRNTLAALFDVSKYHLDNELPITKASDDAAEVEWVETKDLMYRTDVFDDHSAIVYKLTKGNWNVAERNQAE